MTLNNPRGFYGLISGATPTRTLVAPSPVDVGVNTATLQFPDANVVYAVDLTGITSANTPSLNLATGIVTEDSAASADEGVDFEGKTIPALTSVYGVLVVPAAENAAVLEVTGNGSPAKFAGRASKDGVVQFLDKAGISATDLTFAAVSGSLACKVIVIGKA